MKTTQDRAGIVRPTSEVLDQLPPQNMDAERGVLGSILLDPSVCDRVAVILRPEHFYGDAHTRLYRHILAMSDERKRIDVTLLVDRLKKADELKTVGGPAYLAELVHSVAVAAHAVQYAEIVREKALLRSVIQTATEMLRDAYAGTDDPMQVITRAEAGLAAITSDEYAGDPVPLMESCREAMEHIETVLRTGQTGGVMVGLPKFDNDYGGLFPGELTILAARVRIGKSALGRQIGRHVASRGKLVLFASTEMPTRDLTLRDLTAVSDVPLSNIRKGKIGSDDRDRLVEAANQLAGYNMRTMYRPAMTVTTVLRAARRLKKEGLALVIVDYLQRLQPFREDRQAQRYVQVGNMAAACKTMAGELMVPVLCLCQVGREVEQGRGKEAGMIGHPSLASLRESGDIEAHADNVLLLHRQVAGWSGEPVDETTTELRMAKCRNGPTYNYKLVWDGERMTLRDAPDASQAQVWPTDF